MSQLRLRRRTRPLANEARCHFCSAIIPAVAKNFHIVGQEDTSFQFHTTPIYDYVCPSCVKRHLR